MNGPTKDLVFFVDVDESDYSQSSVRDIDDIECVYCCRITGSTPCTCSQEEESSDSESEMEETDSEKEQEEREEREKQIRVVSESIHMHHFKRPDLQVTRIDYGLPPAPAFIRLVSSL